MRFTPFVPAVLLTALCGFPVAVHAGQEAKTPPAVRTESTLNIQGPATDAVEVVPPGVQVPAMVKPRPFPPRRRNIVPRNQNRPVTHRPDGTTVTGDVMEESKITQASSAAQAGLGLQAEVPNPLSRPFSAHPLNFGGLSVVGSPQLWPYSPVVKIFMHFPTSGWFACSGSMVEASHVLTAGHCVFDTDFGEWADQFIVFPGATGYDPPWSSLVAPVGAAGWTEAHSFSGWTLSGDLNYDIGMIDTDRTVGALSGWYGFGYNDTCSFYLNNTFFTPGYPGESPYDGTHMYTRSGVFDECDADSGGSWFGNDLVFYGRSYHGQSGSSQTNASSLIAYGVLSNGDDTFTDSPRILSSEFSALLGIIDNDTPTSVDIVAMGASGSSSAAAGSQVGAMSYVLYNNSTAAVSTTYSVSIYLSTNNFISTSDRLLQTHNVTVNLGARSGIRVNVSSPPVIPGDVGGGSYWLGVIVNAADANTGNNASSGDDAMPITVTSVSCYPNCPRHDFNADGRSDLLWRNTSTGALAIWMMNGTSPTNVSVGTVSDLNWKPVAIGDFDGDGKADILWRNTSTGATAMWLMNGATIVANVGLSVNPSLDWIVAGVGDFDHDGRADILWRSTSSGAVAQWLMSGTTISTNSIMSATPSLDWVVAAVGDYSGDGRADVLWRSASAGTVAMWTMSGTTIIGNTIMSATPSADWTVIASGDFDHDGRADVLWRSASTGGVAEWLMNGTTITTNTILSARPSADWLASDVGDFDADGRADIAWRNTSGANAVWLMNGTSIATNASLPGIADSNWTIVKSK